MASFIGIDLGTTYCAVATIDETGRPMIVHNSDGQNITPSCVAEKSEGVIEVGEYARKTWGPNPSKAAARFKRDMGTSTIHTINGREFTPTQLSTFVLRKLVAEAENVIGTIGEAVVTIPANFPNDARAATMEAAKAAGLDVKFIVNEPTAAALYYAFKSGEELRGTYAVYDLGGGTFDVSIIGVNGQDVDVICSNGIAKLGGHDFDKALQGVVQRKYRELTGDDLEIEDFNLNQAEEEKKALSNRDPVMAYVARKDIEVSRKELEEAISSYIAQTEMLCESTLEEAGIDASDIREVFLVGGSTRMPIVRESVERVFGREPVATANVDEVVALGAALYAAYKGDRDSLSAVQENSIAKIKVGETTSKTFGTISLGFDETRDEMKPNNSILIRKGEPIPCAVTESFYTVHEGQEGVKCRVTESVAPETDPRFVKTIWEGRLELPPGRASGQEIKVTFSYDQNQIMNCTFVDVGTGREEEVDLSMASAGAEGLDEIDKFLVE